PPGIVRRGVSALTIRALLDVTVSATSAAVERWLLMTSVRRSIGVPTATFAGCASGIARVTDGNANNQVARPATTVKAPISALALSTASPAEVGQNFFTGGRTST